MRRKTNGARSLLSRNRLPNLAWKLPYCVSSKEGERMARLVLSPARRAATSYFIPRLHNRLFVSRFYPRSESHPAPSPCERRAATFLPTWDRTGRRIRGDGEKVPRGYRKPSCPLPSSIPFPLYLLCHRAALDLFLSTSSWYARCPWRRPGLNRPATSFVCGTEEQLTLAFISRG